MTKLSDLLLWGPLNKVFISRVVDWGPKMNKSEKILRELESILMANSIPKGRKVITYNEKIGIRAYFDESMYYQSLYELIQRLKQKHGVKNYV